MKIAKVIVVLIFGPLLGVLIGFFLGVVAMPSQVPGGRSPGDGFLIIGCILLCALLSILASAAWAWRIWFRSDTEPRSS